MPRRGVTSRFSDKPIRGSNQSQTGAIGPMAMKICKFKPHARNAPSRSPRFFLFYFSPGIVCWVYHFSGQTMTTMTTTTTTTTTTVTVTKTPEAQRSRLLASAFLLVYVARVCVRACLRRVALSRKKLRDHACPRWPRSILGIHDRYTYDMRIRSTCTERSGGEASVDRMRRVRIKVVRAAVERARHVDEKTRGRKFKAFPRADSLGRLDPP